MPRYILYEIKKPRSGAGNNVQSGKQEKKPIGMVESLEMHRKSNGSNETRSSKSSTDYYENDLKIRQIDPEEKNCEANFLLFDQNLAVIHFETTNPAQTYFELSMFNSSSYLVASPCTILISGVVRLHQPCLEVIYGLNKILLEDNVAELCIISGGGGGGSGGTEIIDLYAVVNRIVAIHDRRQIAAIFFEQSLVVNDGGTRNSNDYRPSKSDGPEYVIYHNDNSRIKPISLVYGTIRTDDLPGPDQTPHPGPALKTEFAELQIRVVINKTVRDDRANLFRNWSLVRVNFVNEASAIVCSLKRQCYFRLMGATIIVAGYLGVIRNANATWAKVISGHQELTIGRGRYTAFLGDNCMLLLPMAGMVKTPQPPPPNGGTKANDDDDEFRLKPWNSLMADK